MTAVEKAQYLYEKMLRVEYPLAAKTCALIAVDEVINCCEEYDKLPETWVTQINYWQEVKRELNKLE